MACREITTQAELDAAKPGECLHVKAGRFEAWDSAHVEAGGSAHVVAWDSAHVVAGGSAHVVARDSAHVEARGSAHVEAGDSAHVVAWGLAHVEAGSQVAVHQHSDRATITGGVVIRVTRPTTAAEWCAHYGRPVTEGSVTVYKAVRADLRSGRGMVYALGSTVVAPDWDDGAAECGGGLHFSPHPAMGLEFDAEATRFLACLVALADIRAPRDGDAYPHKIKARACLVLHEVDRRGRAM